MGTGEYRTALRGKMSRTAAFQPHVLLLGTRLGCSLPGGSEPIGRRLDFSLRRLATILMPSCEPPKYARALSSISVATVARTEPGLNDPVCGRISGNQRVKWVQRLAGLVMTSRDNAQRRAELPNLRRITIPVFARLPAATRRSILHALGKYAPWEAGFDPTPPPVGRDQVTGPPDFVGIGVQKAGTTWWYQAICAHPNVFSRADIHKERHYFGRYVTRPFGPEECALYHGWFPRPSGNLTGEWTPDYMHSPWVPPLLAQAAPNARLLVLLRDPVERFRSGLAHQRRDRGRLTIEAYQDAVARGFYHDELRRWTTYFPREQILVLQYERCAEDPIGQLTRTYRFLGLEPVVSAGLGSRVNRTAKSPSLSEHVRRRLVELYTPDVRALLKSFAELDPSLWPNFAEISDD
jgi:hypothetical protein